MTITAIRALACGMRVRHPQEEGIMTPASANVFFQLSPTHVLENLLLDYVEIVKGSLQ